MEEIIKGINDIVWGPPMLGLLLLTGFFLTFGLRGLSVIRIPYAFKQLFKKRSGEEAEGDVSPFAALMTALSSTIGTGNIAGVAAAIAIGGPGAIFWMWVTAIVGTATKFSEGVLAVRYREIDANGNRVGRIGDVASKVVPFMALLYIGAGLTVVIMNAGQVPTAFGMIFKGAFGLQGAGTGISIGLLMLAMQKGVARGIFSNEAGQGSAPIAHAAAQNNDPVNQGIIAMLGTVIDTLIVCTITALVILTSGVMTPECLAGPETLSILVSGDQPFGCDTSAPLTASAFDATLTGVGKHIVAIGLAVFAFTTILGWSYYGERCASFLFSEKAIIPYRMSWIAVVFSAAAVLILQTKDLVIETGKATLEKGILLIDGKPYLIEGNPLELGTGEVTMDGTTVLFDGDPVQVEGLVGNIVNLFWLMADALTGLMAAPNLIALVLLSPVVFKLAREYFDKEKIASDGLIDQDDIPPGKIDG